MQQKCDEDLLYAMPDVFLLSNNSLHYSSCPPWGGHWAISEDFCGGRNWSDPDIEWVGIGDAVHVPECTGRPRENHVAPMSAVPSGETLHYGNCPLWMLDHLILSPQIFLLSSLTPLG